MADVLTGRTYAVREDHPERERRIQRILVFTIVILSLILAGELVFHLVVAPRLIISSISLDSDLPISDAELFAAAGVREGMRFLSLNVDEVTARIERHPAVREAQVQATFPNHLSISVTRRVPLAAALAQSNGTTVPLVFDEDGVVFQAGAGAQIDGLPVISGLRFATVDVGLQLPALVVDFLRQLRRIRMDEPALFRLFSEYRIVQKNDFSYEVVLYPMHYPLPVRIGTSIDADMIQYVVMMLDVLQRDGRLASAAELDFRSGEGVLRPREARSDDRASSGGR